MQSKANSRRIRRILAGLCPVKITSRGAECEKSTSPQTGGFLCAQRSAGPHRLRLRRGRETPLALKRRRAVSGQTKSLVEFRALRREKIGILSESPGIRAEFRAFSGGVYAGKNLLARQVCSSPPVLRPAGSDARRRAASLHCPRLGRGQGTLMPEKAVEAFFGSFYLSSRKYERPRWAGGWFSRLFLSETIISTAMVTR